MSPFSETLLSWYAAYGRDLPWRRSTDPYPIWLSEVILQQTRIAQGQAYWERFMERFPTVESLAQASEDEVLRLPLDTFTRYSSATRFLEAECPENLIPAVAKSYPVGGFVLVPVTDMREVTAAQYIDFQTFAPDADAHLVELLSVSLVPEGMTYNDGYDLADVQAAIREHLSVQDALALVADFFRRWLALTRATLNSLDKELKKADRIKDATKRAKLQAEIVMRKKQLRTLSTPVGDGLRKWTS